MPFWWPHAQQPPELVAEREVEIGPDGKVKVEIDTELAKAIHPDQDHRYTITAEVVDQSRRTIVGEGHGAGGAETLQGLRLGRSRLLSHRRHDPRPFAPTRSTTSRSRAGDAHAAADHLPRTGRSRWRRPCRPGRSTDEEGQAQQQMTASQAGQYRLSYKLTDGKKHTIEGGYLFTIIGQGFDSAQFRFNHLELIPDKADYAPGEKVKLQINTDRAGGTVLLFLRPGQRHLSAAPGHPHGRQEHGGGNRGDEEGHAQLLRRGGGGGRRPRLYRSQADHVPPEKRVLDVEVVPSAATYRPGQKAKVKIKLTDAGGSRS